MIVSHRHNNMIDITKTNKLLASDIIEHTRIYQEAKNAIKSYYYFNSNLMRAIQKHIARAENCVLIDRTGQVNWDSSGYAVRFKDIMVFGPQWRYNKETGRDERYELDYFNLDIVVEYYNEEDDKTENNQYTIKVPIDLEINFTQEKFDAWINEMTEKFKIKQEKKDKETFDALRKNYPQWFSL